MKKFLIPAMMISAALAFNITQNSYGAYEDFDAVCQMEFGKGYTTASWEDIKKAYEKAGDKERFLKELGFDSYDKSYIITTAKGGFFEEGDRRYIITYHDHRLPTNYTYLSHDNIEEHLMDLGSWNEIDYKVICKKDKK